MGRTLPKKIRELIYKKYDGHCAYCGCELQYKDMQVDHIKSVYLHNDYHKDMTEEELNQIDNLMPACRMCNFYKSEGDIEHLRKRLTDTLMNNIRKSFDYRLALKYNLIKENIHPIVFYFEQQVIFKDINKSLEKLANVLNNQKGLSDEQTFIEV